MSVDIKSILSSLMHRRVPSWWKEAGVSGTKQLYQPEKPVVYIVPITSILRRLPLIPAGPGGPRHHSCGAERPQVGALSAEKMRRGRAAGHRQQALLHPLVGQVLAHQPPQETSDRLSRVCTKSTKSASGTLGAHFVLSKWYSNADMMQKNNIPYAHFMHTMYKLYARYVQTM